MEKNIYMDNLETLGVPLDVLEFAAHAFPDTEGLDAAAWYYLGLHDADQVAEALAGRREAVTAEALGDMFGWMNVR